VSDNTILNAGSGGDTVSTDDIAGVKVQRVKIQQGADGAATDVHSGSPLYVRPSDGTNAVAVTGANALKVDGSAVTQPVSGGSQVFHVDDNSSSLTVDGTITANIGTSGSLATQSTLAAVSSAQTDGTQKTKVTDGTNVVVVTNTTPGGSDYGLVTRATGTTTVSGTVTANAGTGPFPVSDNSGSLTVDAPAATPVATAITDTSNTLVKPGDAGNNAIRVNIVAGAGSGGTAQADKSTFTEGTTTFTPVGAVLNDTISADPTEDQAAALRMTAKRGLHANLRSATGVELASATSTPGGSEQALIVRNIPSGTQAVSGTVTANAGTGPFPVSDNSGSLTVDAPAATPVAVAITDTSNTLVKPGDAGNNAIRVNIVAGAGSGGTAQADKSTFTEGSTTFTPSGGVLNDTISADPTEDQAAAVRITAKRAFHTNLRKADGTELATATTTPGGSDLGLVVRNIPSGTQTISGTVTANPGAGNFATNTLQLGGTNIDTNSGTKSAGTQRIVIATDQPALTNALKVDGSAVTQPVSGTVTANAGSGTFTISGTVTANAGTGTLAVDSELPAAAALADATANPTTTSVGALALGWNGSTWDRERSGNDTTQVTQSLSMTSTANAITVSSLVGYGGVGVRITWGTGTGTLVFEGSVDGTNFQPVNMVAISGTAGTVSTGAVANTVTQAAGDVQTQGNITGFTAFRVRVSTAGTNSSTVSIRASRGTSTVALSSALPAGTNTIGALSANQSVNQTQWAGTAVDTNSGSKSAGTLRVTLATDQVQLTNALKVDGSAVTQPVSGTVTANAGTGPFPVSDNAGSLTVDAPASSPLAAAITDTGNTLVKPGDATNNAIRVNLVAGSTTISSGAVTVSGSVNTTEQLAVADNAPFTDATTPVFPAGYYYDDNVSGATALTENDVAAGRIDSKRAQVLVIEDETTRGQRLTITASKAMKVDGSAVTQPISIAATVTTKAVTSATATTNTVNALASSTTLLTSNSNRLGYSVYNDSTSILYLKNGTTASNTSYTLQVPANGYYECPFNYTGNVDGIWVSATGAARVVEYT